MQGLKIFALISVVVFFAGCSQYKLVWSDEFDGTEIKKGNFTHDVYPGVVSTAREIQYYTDRPNNSFIKNGNLVISVNKEKHEGHEYTSARLNTYGKFDFRYGKIEARIKMPSGNNLQSRFWMLPVTLDYGSWASSGQIDIVQAIGEKPAAVSGGLYFAGPSRAHKHVSKEYAGKNIDFSQGYHIYTLQWQPYEMQWLVDGKLHAVQNQWNSVEADYPAPFDKPFYLVLNVAVLKGIVGDMVTWPQQMSVDWIRVYTDESGNKSPKVKILSPADETEIATGDDIVIKVAASDPENKLDRVEFYNGDELIGRDKTPPYSFAWPGPDGCHDIMVKAIDEQGYVRAAFVEVVKGVGCLPTPFHGKPSEIPGKIEAEDFDQSNKAESYYDRDPSNNGGAYRLDTEVDIQTCNEGGYNIGWMENEEWMQYTVDVKAEGNYDIKCRVASPRENVARFRIEFDGVDKTGGLIVPHTGDWQIFTDLVAENIKLSAGKQVMKVFVEEHGFNFNYVEITPSKTKD